MISSYDKLPILTYLDINDVLEDKRLDEIDKQIEIISLLTNMSIEEISNLSLADYNALAKKSMFLKDIPKRSAPKNKYIIGENVYIPTLTMQKMCVAQYIDYSNYNLVEDKKTALIGMLSTLMIPEGKRYGSYDIEIVKRDMEKLSAKDVNDLSGFFFDYSKGLLMNMQRYLTRITKKLIRKEKNGKMREEMKMKLRSIVGGNTI